MSPVVKLQVAVHSENRQLSGTVAALSPDDGSRIGLKSRVFQQLNYSRY